MNQVAQNKRSQKLAESGWTQLFEVLHIYGLGKIVYNTMVHGSRPTLDLIEPGIFWGLFYLVLLCFILYASCKTIWNNGRMEPPLKPVPLFLLTAQAGVIFLYLACLFIFYSDYTLLDIMKAL